MKILMISPVCPLPLEKGGAIRIWNIAKQLSKRHEVHLLCFIRKDKERLYETELKQVFTTVKFVKRRDIVSANRILQDFWSFVTKNFSLLWDTLFSGRPLLSVLYDSPEMKDVLLEVDGQGYDLLYAETYYVLSSVKEELSKFKTPLFLIEQNIESSAFERQVASQKNPLVKSLMEFDVSRLKKEEELYWKKVKHLGGLSEEDVRILKGRSGRDDVVMLENGVDVAFFDEKVVEERLNNEVLFVGSLSYHQNINAVMWLVDEIWPMVIQKLREKEMMATLRIVGRGADVRLKEKIWSARQEIDEGVDDIRTAFQRATLLIAPIRAGSGTKYKVLEAMASRLPIVTTPVGAEGLAVEDGTQMMIGVSGEELSEKIVAMLEDTEKRNEIADEAYRFVKERYNWESIVDNFERDLSTWISRS